MQGHIHGLLREHLFFHVGFWSEAPEKMFDIYLQKVFETSYKLIEVTTSSRKILVKRKNQ